MPEASKQDVAQRAGFYRSGQQDNEIGQRALDIAGGRAERKVREEITDSEYDDIVSNSGSRSSDYSDMKDAEALLAAYYALPSLNMRITKKGGLQRRTGTVDNENDLMSYSEMDAYRDGWFGDAMDILDDLSPASSDERDTVYAM